MTELEDRVLTIPLFFDIVFPDAKEAYANFKRINEVICSFRQCLDDFGGLTD